MQGPHSFNSEIICHWVRMGELWPSLKWRVLHQELNCFHLLEVLVPQKSLKLLLCVYLDEELGSCLQGYSIVSWLLLPYFCILSHPLLVTVWIAVWNSSKWNRLLCLGAPQGPAHFQGFHNNQFEAPATLFLVAASSANMNDIWPQDWKRSLFILLGS